MPADSTRRRFHMSGRDALLLRRPCGDCRTTTIRSRCRRLPTPVSLTNRRGKDDGRHCRQTPPHLIFLLVVLQPTSQTGVVLGCGTLPLSRISRKRGVKVIGERTGVRIKRAIIGTVVQHALRFPKGCLSCDEQRKTDHGRDH